MYAQDLTCCAVCAEIDGFTLANSTDLYHVGDDLASFESPELAAKNCSQANACVGEHKRGAMLRPYGI